MRKQIRFVNFVGLFFMAGLMGKNSLACGGMVLPGSLLCSSTSGGGYSTGYPSLTASVVYVPTSLLGGYSQPISYPPNPLAPTSYPSYSSYLYPAYNYGYGSGLGYPYSSYGYGTGLGYPYGYFPSSLTSGFLGSGGLFGGLGTCNTGSLLSGGGYPGLFPLYGSNPVSTPITTFPVVSYPINTAPVVTIANPGTHGCSSQTGMGSVPVYSIPRPVCTQFCGVARNLLRPISRELIGQSRRLY